MLESMQKSWRTTSVMEAGREASTRRDAEVRRPGPAAQSVLQAANERLNRNPDLRRGAISCEFRQGVLSLYGHLSSYYQKQIAQEAVRRLDGVQRVVNHIQVVTQAT